MPQPGLLASFLKGEVTLAHLLDRIRRSDAQLHCWTEVRAETSAQDGPLKGVPFGVKDIFEARGYRTSYGSALYATHVSQCDAGLISLLRARGAVVLGKTHTTAFAYYDPAPTRNPRRPTHTPGGSSSGSAAAVAAGMVPFAIGSQTQGSVIRPASFCGVVGFKPTYGLLPMDGALPFAPSLDTAGLFTQTAFDLRLLWEGMGYSVHSDPPSQYGLMEFDVEPEMQEFFRMAIQTLGQYGCQVRRFEIPPHVAQAQDAVRIVNQYEGARSNEERYRKYGPAIGVKLAQLVREGLKIPPERYEQALETLRRARQEIAELFQTFPVILSPAAPGWAPSGLASTGDPRCNAVWTGLHVPALTIPIPVPKGLLPLGLQMCAAPRQEALLIAAAMHCQALLNAPAR
ncbi:MAG: amidase [Bryobacteraceae bacterium]|nr:amidase [Bryobacteraceae bacterium]MDW8377929.1 amidase [Bryobacterales bacterium]